MVRYPVGPQQLRDLVVDVSPNFLDLAAERTARFRAAGRYDETSGIWSRVKRVYMELQGFKCGFCERRLEKSRFGNIEHDVEHFRPKSSVRAWPSESVTRDRGHEYTFQVGNDADPGYFLLAYHLENYLIACKTCNTSLKSNAFPVSRARQTRGDTPRNMRGEMPFLIYPIGAGDDDPESLITFRGILPLPVRQSGHRRRRAELTIDFFELDTREVLLEERAETLLALHIAMVSAADADPGVRASAELLVQRRIDRRSPHANCARRHHALFQADRARADEFVEAAVQYLVSLSRD